VASCGLRRQRPPTHVPPRARPAGCARARLRPCARPRSGLLPSLIGVCHVAIQFPLYEYAKEQLAQRSGCSPDELPPGQLVRGHATEAEKTSFACMFGGIMRTAPAAPASSDVLYS